MNFNEHAFSGVEDRRYANWDGNTQVLTYQFIQAIKHILDLEQVQTVFDIGSRDSCQARELSDWFPNSKIYLFEPVPSSFNWCVNHTKNKNNIFCFDIALSNSKGESSFYQVNNGNIGASSLYKVDSNFGTGMTQTEIKIQSDTGKNFMEEFGIDCVDIIWADVQGSELECFKGFGDQLTKVKAVHTEVAHKSYYEGGTDFTSLQSFMIDQGFELVKVFDNVLGLEVDVVYVNKRYLRS